MDLTNRRLNEMVALVVKNLPVNGDVRDASSTLSREDPLELHPVGQVKLAKSITHNS